MLLGLRSLLLSLPGTFKLGIKQKRKKQSLQRLHQDLTSWKSKLHTPTSDRALTTTRDTQIGTSRVSTLISASVVLESGSPTPGRLYVAVFIEDEEQVIQATLFKGYVYAQHPVDGNGALVIREGDRLRIESKSSLAGITLRIRGRQLRNQVIPGGWTGMSEGILDGPGFIRSISSSNPAAGTFTVTESVPSGARWKLRGVRAPLVTDSNVDDRFVAVLTDDGSTSVTEGISSIALAASSVREYFFVPGVGAYQPAIVSTDEVVPIGIEIWLFAGFRISLTLIEGARAGDDFGVIQFFVEEWLEP